MGRAYQNRKVAMAKTAAAKTKVYSKYSREIYMAAKNGIDPSGNLALRGILDRAKKDQVPAHVIQKALDKAKGGGGEDYAVARYEGFGPASCMVLVDCLTDNPNRTFGDVRQCFTKTKSKLGTPGTVAHMFDHSVILVFSGPTEEEVLDALMEADVNVTDIENEEGKLTVFAPQEESFKAKHALQEAFGDIDYDVDEIQFLPQSTITIDGEEDTAMFEKLLEMLDELDDVQAVYHNVDL